jgi:hypothetical protein
MALRSRRLGRLGCLFGMGGDRGAGDVPKDETQSGAKQSLQWWDNGMCHAAIGTRIVAILHQRDRSRCWTQDMVALADGNGQPWC